VSFDELDLPPPFPCRRLSSLCIFLFSSFSSSSSHRQISCRTDSDKHCRKNFIVEVHSLGKKTVKIFACASRAHADSHIFACASHAHADSHIASASAAGGCAEKYMTMDDINNAELLYVTVPTAALQKADVSYDDLFLACACCAHTDSHTAATGRRAEKQMPIDNNCNAEFSYATISTVCSQKADVSYDGSPLACVCCAHADFHIASASLTGRRAGKQMTIDDTINAEFSYATICSQKADILILLSSTSILLLHLRPTLVQKN
jgi:hypothetical protein